MIHVLLASGQTVRLNRRDRARLGYVVGKVSITAIAAVTLIHLGFADVQDISKVIEKFY